jgi:hypothetical protein
MTAVTDEQTVTNTPTAYDVLPGILAAAARDGIDVGDLLGYACSEATRLLPRGMNLTHARPGSWEASHVDGLTDPAAVMEGPGAQPLEVECDTCWARVGEMCWNPKTYAENRHPHRSRVTFAREATVFVPGLGWMA